MLAHVLALTLALAQQTALRARADDPLHRSVTVQAAADGATVEHFAQATGSLSIWASSEALDPRLRVEVLGRDGLLEDDDSGGGTTAWLLVEVEAGEALEIAVAASEPGAVELHVVAAPESDATRAAVARETEELAELVRLLSEGAGEEGRRRAAALVEELLATPGA
ncbi:MAG: hypothetical protein KC466_20050, partial [Myxococcales bacterium]|nr:hypothetical protein [Myxococcales bacterium]